MRPSDALELCLSSARNTLACVLRALFTALRHAFLSNRMAPDHSHAPLHGYLARDAIDRIHSYQMSRFWSGHRAFGRFKRIEDS